MGKASPDRPRQCGTCLYFRQHYVKLGRRYVPVSSGHCAYPGAWKRRDASETCPLWTEPDRA